VRLTKSHFLFCLFHQDYFTSGFSAPQADSQQDWMLSYSGEENGVTTLRFYRKPNTYDQQNDVVIQVKKRRHNTRDGNS